MTLAPDTSRATSCEARATPGDARRAASAAPRRLPAPRRPRVLGSDVTMLVCFVVGVTLALWVAHGGPAALVAGGLDTLLALSQLSGLVAALAALAGLVLVVRPTSLERAYGLDTLWGWHRWVGITTVVAVLVHTVVATVAHGVAERRGPVPELVALVADQPWMLAALVSTVLFTVVGLTSWRRIRTRIAYETWYFVHLCGYLAVLLGFAHQITIGSDFVGDTAGRWWWISWYLIVATMILWDRVGGLLRAVFRGPVRVVAVVPEAPGVVSITLGGRGLRRTRASAGQFFLLRFATRELWWQAHPVSLSAAPTEEGLRFTVKDLGDGSALMQRLTPGTRAVVEGPYGTMTAAAAEGRPVLLVGGGVGIAPLRAVLEDCRPSQRPVVVVRAHRPEDVVHRQELERLVTERQGRLHVLAGPRAWFAGGDPFAASVLLSEVPDLPERHVFVCGPRSLERAVEKGLRVAGVPTAAVHVERFGV